MPNVDPHLLLPGPAASGRRDAHPQHGGGAEADPWPEPGIGLRAIDLAHPTNRSSDHDYGNWSKKNGPARLYCLVPQDG
jgi:hypothetical protein